MGGIMFRWKEILRRAGTASCALSFGTMGHHADSVALFGGRAVVILEQELAGTSQIFYRKMHNSIVPSRLYSSTDCHKNVEDAVRMLLNTRKEGMTRLGMHGGAMTAGLGTKGISPLGLRISEGRGRMTFYRMVSSSRVQMDEGKKQRKRKATTEENENLVVADEEEFSAITDKIPQRPMTVVEGTSYSLVIIAALAFAAAVLYAALSELVFSPKEYLCYSKTLERIKDDPRVTIRLGSQISAYGSESQNRAARQRIPHRVYTDNDGREHVQLQFHAKGPSGKAVVHADMYKEDGEWRYHFLYLTVESPLPQQVVLVRPGQPDQ